MRSRRLLKVTAVSLMVVFAAPTPLWAGLDSRKAAYQGGTTKERDFPGARDAVEGVLDTGDADALRFVYRLHEQDRVYSIPYAQFVDIEYGQKAGRRVGAAVATGILLSPVGLFMLFSKKRKHFVTIGYRDDADQEQVAVFELGKDIVRVTLPILEARSGRKIEYQDDDARKAGRQ